MRNRPSQIGKKVATVLLGVFVALMVGEGLLAWLVPPPAIYRYPQTLHAPNATLGWLPRPSQRAYTHDKPVITDSFGFRSDELAPLKPEGGLRVLCLGDSQTFGNGVEQDRTYAGRLQAFLRQALPGRPVEVANAGVQAFDTEQEVALLERLAPILKPDVVVIGFYLNDIAEVLRIGKTGHVNEGTGEFKRRGFLNRLIPYRLIYMLKRSRCITLVNWQMHVLRTRSPASLHNAVLEGRTLASLETGWEVIEAALRRAQRLADSDGFRLIVFPVPTPQEFAGDYPNEQYRSRFIALASSLELEHFDPTPAMLGRRRARRAFRSMGRSHQRGHARADCPRSM